jgi:hypothetical protein
MTYTAQYPFAIVPVQGNVVRLLVDMRYESNFEPFPGVGFQTRDEADAYVDEHGLVYEEDVAEESPFSLN